MTASGGEPRVIRQPLLVAVLDEVDQCHSVQSCRAAAGQSRAAAWAPARSWELNTEAKYCHYRRLPPFPPSQCLSRPADHRHTTAHSNLTARQHRAGAERIHRADVGPIDLTCEWMDLTADPSAFTADSGAARRVLNVLASWAATPELAAARRDQAAGHHRS